MENKNKNKYIPRKSTGSCSLLIVAGAFEGWNLMWHWVGPLRKDVSDPQALGTWMRVQRSDGKDTENRT